MSCRVFRKRRMNRSTDHLLVWNDPIAFQNLLGRTKTGWQPSMKNANSESGDRTVQHNSTTNMTDLRTNVQHSPRNRHSANTTVCYPTDSGYSTTHPIPSNSPETIVGRARTSTTGIILVIVHTQYLSHGVQISPKPLPTTEAFRLDALSNSSTAKREYR